MNYELVSICCQKEDGFYEVIAKTNNGNNIKLLLKTPEADPLLISAIAVNEDCTDVKALMLLKSPIEKSLGVLVIGDILEFVA